MTDRITITDLRLDGRVGWTEEERAAPQKLLIGLSIEADLGPPSRSDDLDDTIDYGAIVEEVAQIVGASEHKLLERLAGEIAERIVGLAGVSRVTVKVSKEDPPLDREIGGIAVEIDRGSS